MCILLSLRGLLALRSQPQQRDIVRHVQVMVTAAAMAAQVLTRGAAGRVPTRRPTQAAAMTPTRTAMAPAKALP